MSRGAGPDIVLPSISNTPSWQGHKNCFTSSSQFIPQPRCGQFVENTFSELSSCRTTHTDPITNPSKIFHASIFDEVMVIFLGTPTGKSSSLPTLMKSSVPYTVSFNHGCTANPTTGATTPAARVPPMAWDAIFKNLLLLLFSALLSSTFLPLCIEMNQ